jgi:hypothetical protein
VYRRKWRDDLYRKNENEDVQYRAAQYFYSLQENPISNRKMNCSRVRTDFEENMRFLIRSRCDTLPAPENRRRWYAEAAGSSGRCPRCPDKIGTLKHILNECFKDKENLITNRHNLLVAEVETALLKYTNYARAIHGGKIIKDHFLNIRDLPEDCRLRRPDLLVQNASVKKIHVYEFACPFAKTYKNGDALKRAHEFKEGKCAKLGNEVRSRFQGWDVQLITVIVSSLGAIYKDSLKRLALVMELTPVQTVGLGQRLSDAAVIGSRLIWANYQRAIKEAPAFSASGSTPEVESMSEDSTDFEQSLGDAEKANEHTQTVVLDCVPGELGFEEAIVAEVAHEDDTTEPTSTEEYGKIVEDEDDRPLSDDEEEDEVNVEEIHP